jgi:N-acetylglutamate synthase
MPMDVAVLEVTDWYTDRGLRPTAASPEPRLDEDDTEQLLAAAGAFETAGWRPIEGAGALVLTGPIGELRGAGNGLPAGLTARMDDRPDADWLAQYRYRGQPVPEHGVQLLLSAPEQVFASIRDGDQVVGVARGSLADRWAGLTAMEVHPDYRRQGLARALIAAIAQWAWQRGSRSAYVQAAETNLPAQRLYQATGFTPHHNYAYLTPTAS